MTTIITLAGDYDLTDKLYQQLLRQTSPIFSTMEGDQNAMTVIREIKRTSDDHAERPTNDTS